MASKKSTRSNYYTFVAYPESVPKNWKDIIDENHIQWAASPLHDKDVNPTGDIKKAHWHILLAFESLKSQEQAQSIADSVNATMVQSVHSVKGMIRYFTHMDNPEKAQYDRAEISCHGGFDLDEMLKPVSANKYHCISEMIDFIEENNITEYVDLVIYARHNEPDWFAYLADSCTYMISQYIKSKREKRAREKQKRLERINEVDTKYTIH